MFSRERTLRDLRRKRDAGAVTGIAYAKEKVRITAPKPMEPPPAPRSGMMLSMESIENGRQFTRFAIKLIAVALVIAAALAFA